MNPRLLFPVTILTISFAVAICASQTLGDLHSKFSQTYLNRTRRYLVFATSGTFKYVFGVSHPLNFMEKRPFRHMTVSYSIHVQYALATSPLYWWTYFTNSSAWAPSDGALNPAESRKHSYDHNPHLKHYGTCVQRKYKQPAIVYDYSRSFIYKAVAMLLSGKGLPGARCVLRAICEFAQRSAGGQSFYDRIINAVFRPVVANIDSQYLHALKVGLKGTDCERIYWGCNKMIKWLKELEHYF